MKVGIASDHAGYAQKCKLAVHLAQRGEDVTDFGPFNDDRVDYPDYAETVARAVVEGDVDCGVLVCGTGIGMAVAANKIAGIRAANVVSPEFAALAREHNNANIVTVSGRFVDEETNKRIIDAFLDTPFAGGRHAGRLEKIARLESAAR